MSEDLPEGFHDKETELDFESDGSEQISENDPEDDFPINEDPKK